MFCSHVLGIYRTWGLIMVCLFTSLFLVVEPFGNEMLSSYLLAPSPRIDYTNNQLFKIYTRTPEDLALLKRWQVELRPLQLDFWDDALPDYFNPFHTSFLVRVPPQSVKDFTGYLIAAEIDYQISSHDLKKLVQWEKMTVATAQQAGRNRGSGMVIAQSPGTDRYPNHRRVLLPGVHTLASYLPLENVNNFIDSIVDRHPVMASTFEIGRSFEGRPIRGIKIGTPFMNFGETTFEDPQSVPPTVKKAILIDGAMQGRDWITVPALLYLVQQLLSRYDIDDRARFMLDTYDWYIVRPSFLIS
ncbi:hypothetical protein RvY_12699-2 [Ramazzottius varieornatus]|uniref:Peptidase M14 domain-containing protein n=1 Tax=Ramazzottius varieornatus TaxID=947166 RepID=A0A1D1VPK4_RAMVA|nr:hypothetical protein RvY_12699-2 [Ramazzottius varieornatus]